MQKIPQVHQAVNLREPMVDLEGVEPILEILDKYKGSWLYWLL